MEILSIIMPVLTALLGIIFREIFEILREFFLNKHGILKIYNNSDNSNVFIENIGDSDIKIIKLSCFNEFKGAEGLDFYNTIKSDITIKDDLNSYYHNIIIGYNNTIKKQEIRPLFKKLGLGIKGKYVAVYKSKNKTFKIGFNIDKDSSTKMNNKELKFYLEIKEEKSNIDKEKLSLRNTDKWYD